MSRLQITDVWSEEYFTPRFHPQYRLTYIQRFMAKRLYDEILAILEMFPDTQFFKDIGLVLPEELPLYKRQNFNIPESSDLYYGLPVPYTGKSKKFVYGDWNTYSVGAIQLNIEGSLSIQEIFQQLVKTTYLHKLRLWDIALVSGGQLKDPYIYISNLKSVMYNARMTRRLRNKQRFITSDNGGISHKIYTFL